MLYRDLKLDNVLLHADGHIMLCDLGSISDKTGVLHEVYESNTTHGEDSMSSRFSPVFAPHMRDNSTYGICNNSDSHSDDEDSRVQESFNINNSDEHTPGRRKMSTNNSSNPSTCSPQADIVTIRRRGSSRSNSIVGTLGYMAPEIIRLFGKRGKQDSSHYYTEAVDWWSLGILIHTLAMGRNPFLGDTFSYSYISHLFPSEYERCNRDLEVAYTSMFGKLTFNENTHTILKESGEDIVAGLLSILPENRFGRNKTFNGDGDDWFFTVI